MRVRFLVVLVSSVMLSSCGWQSYVISRGIRHLTGAPTRFHTIVPIRGGLDQYRVIEVQPLENMILGLLPDKSESYINDQIFRNLQSVKSKPMVVRASGIQGIEEDATLPTNPTLVFEGYIDDYDAGYATLRLAELGFNHVAVTIRFRLRDKETGTVVAAASITSQDNRATATTKAAINRIANRIKGFVSSGYGGEE